MKTVSSRPTKKQLATATFATLYPNGVVILHHEKPDPDAGTVEWVTAWETTLYANHAVSFSKQAVRLLFAADFQGARYLANNRSQACEQLGLDAGLIELQFDGYTLDYIQLPGVLHTAIRPAGTSHRPTPDMPALRDAPRWGSLPITNL
jgi:hypothetical protein